MCVEIHVRICVRNCVDLCSRICVGIRLGLCEQSGWVEQHDRSRSPNQRRGAEYTHYFSLAKLIKTNRNILFDCYATPFIKMFILGL